MSKPTGCDTAHLAASVDAAILSRHVKWMTTPLPIFCDESGHTGPRLLDPVQRIFTFSAVAIDDAEAFEILRDARAAHPVQMPELKAGALLKSPAGLALMQFVLERSAGRFRAVAYDKVLALAGKLFEYVYEPVLQHDPGIVYRKDLHRFVAMYCYMFFTEDDVRGEQALRQFERYMRTLRPEEAPLLFDPPFVRPDEEGDPFAMVLTFSRACRDIIVSDNREAEEHSPDRGKWLLDLAISSLWSLLDDYGAERRPLQVICDDSKPLRAQAGNFVDDSLAFAQARAAELLPDRQRNGFALSEPVGFGDSRNHPGLQIADIVAGGLAKVLSEMSRRDDAPMREDLRPLADLLLPAMSQHSVMPDYDRIDTSGRTAAVNWTVLQHLADEAAHGRDPRAGLERWYDVAEVAFVRGDFASLSGDG